MFISKDEEGRKSFCKRQRKRIHTIILASVSAGILFINMLIFYLYNALMDIYIKLEENVIFERKLESYANQLDVLMQSEEKISALRHDMKHHLNELLIMAKRNEDNNHEITDYI